MTFRLALLFLLLLAAVAPTAAVAQEGGGDDHEATSQGGGQTRDLVPVVLWTAATVIAAGVVASVLYMFKRRIGAFPPHPEWVAPISVMRSQDFPDESTPGGVTDAHASTASGHH